METQEQAQTPGVSPNIPLQEFRLTGNVTFQAQDEKDAYNRLVLHFIDCKNDNASIMNIFETGDIRLSRINVPDDQPQPEPQTPAPWVDNQD